MNILFVVALLGLVGCSEAMSPDDGSSTTTQDRALSQAPAATTAYATTSDNKQIAYRVVGSGPQDIVLVHGWSVSGAVYDRLIPQLASADYRLIIPDLRGSGGSDKPNGGYSIENYLKDIDAVADHAGASRFVLAGHSMGGGIAQKYAAKNGQRIDGLILMSPVPASGFPLPPSVYDLFAASAYDLDLSAIIFQISSVNLSPAEFQLLMDSAATMSSKAIRQSLDAWVEADFADMIHQIDAPTRVVVSDDPFMNPALLQQLVADPIGPNASVEYFSGGGHYLQVEEPAQTAAVIDNFVSGL